MAEYIEKEALYQKIAELEMLARDRYLDTPTNSPAYTRYMTQLGERTNLKFLVADFPAVDAVEVVRCKDCKWSGMYAFGCGDTETLACLEIEEDGFIRFATAVDPNGFCSNGERRVDA